MAPPEESRGPSDPSSTLAYPVPLDHKEGNDAPTPVPTVPQEGLLGDTRTHLCLRRDPGPFRRPLGVSCGGRWRSHSRPLGRDGRTERDGPIFASLSPTFPDSLPRTRGPFLKTHRGGVEPGRNDARDAPGVGPPWNLLPRVRPQLGLEHTNTAALRFVFGICRGSIVGYPDRTRRVSSPWGQGRGPRTVTLTTK